ncbi:stage V sporulation protein AC [Brevibacillus composti]|uniref:Stage V sporulation protein AC n=1 Tax=Brevibacillus composti TaxID=2796470 RepID=A0A7T5JPT2_9BACL|nr:stage V sporulation protein AC [Brevibacillus composti]QQE75614.1 stage V sporulation protein AC [Brevibacillus composti]QUO42640.1 stage V sporulation protein AC [Brevibacillus composti]
MADQKKKKLTLAQQQYQQLAKRHEPPRPLLRNFVRAFLVGGVICLIGQGIQEMFIRYFDFTEKTAAAPTVAVLIFLSALLTGLGVYDRIAQWAGAGTSVPVTGFANSITSAAIEHRSEGFVLGVGGNMFKLAGSVIVFGVFAAFVVGIVKTLFKMGG